MAAGTCPADYPVPAVCHPAGFAATGWRPGGFAHHFVFAVAVVAGVDPANCSVVNLLCEISFVNPAMPLPAYRNIQ